MEPKLSFITHSQGLRFESSGLTSILGVLPILQPRCIPGEFSFAVTVGITGVDSRHLHTLGVTIKDDADDVIVNTGKAAIHSQDPNTFSSE